ncbi:MAG TPA: TlpA disulfide reductase family protein [Thermoanaerobaculia bacterium]|nr:TlpA disulfide reductase family protein [Thermoanaerobaculia bacterium]
MRRHALILLIAALTACGDRTETLGPVTMGSDTAPPGVAAVGSPMPSYSAPLLDGSQFDIASERGNVVFLNLWATWCGPCRYEIPELEKLHNDLADRRFKVVGVSVDEGSDQVVREFVDEAKMTYPVALDPAGRLATILDTTILPTSIIVDRRGNVVWKKFGVVSAGDPEMMRVLETALAGRTATGPSPAPSGDRASLARRGGDPAAAG